MFLREPLNVDMNFKEGFVEIQAAASDPPHKLLHSKKIWQKKANDVFNILETGVWNIQRFSKILHRWRAVRPSETFCKVQIKYQV